MRWVRGGGGGGGREEREREHFVDANRSSPM